MQDKLLSIQEAGKLLGVSAKTLRRWETRGILTAQRTVGNQRRYLKSQIENFKTYRELGITEQFTPLDSAKGNLTGLTPQQPSTSQYQTPGVPSIDWKIETKRAGTLIKKGAIIASFASLVVIGTATLGFAL